MNRDQFMKLLKEGRKLQVQKEQVFAKIFKDHNFDDVYFQGTNADNLTEAICCFIDYGELPLSENLDVLYLAYQKAVLDQDSWKLRK